MPFQPEDFTSAAFTSIKTGSSTTDGGFKVGDTFKVAESGDVLGVYAIDYFSEDYTLTGISNNGFIKVVLLEQTDTQLNLIFLPWVLDILEENLPLR